ncbi:MAG: aspartate kinase [Treponema sp.]|nr:aspartate kinase [Treponema sp.]MBD5411879.1 aspartate kinase [Treponema sp.]MBD5443333.1 aspartate kinase [Treponema sp.]MDE6245333.1 aspartate kinase [Treponemataceae bacterium]
MIVMKFGGSSVANEERIQHVASIIKAYQEKKPVVVLSAMGDTTDFLLEAAEKALLGTVDIAAVEDLHRKTVEKLGISIDSILPLLDELKQLLTGVSMLKELSRRSRDYLVSFGERMSVRIMAEYLNRKGIKAQSFDAWEIGFISDSKFMAAELLDDVWTRIPEHLTAYQNDENSAIPIVTGFIAKDKDGNITTLGRGGSDLTATMIGSAMKALEVQTWKDVDGIMTADPRLVSNARTVPEVTYEEAEELAMFGAQVLHPRSMIPVRKTATPVRVKNSYNIESQGTIIVERHSIKVPPVCAITSVKHVSIFDIVSTRMLGAAGFLAHIFNQFLKWHISIDVIATSEVSVSCTVNYKGDMTGLIADLKNVADVEVRNGKAIVTIVCDASHSSAILASGFEALSEEGINVQMISKGASKVNISVLVNEEEADRTVQVLHKAFFE